MYKYFIGSFLMLFLVGCTQEKDAFLEKFNTLDKMPSTQSLKGVKFTDTIPLKDIKTVFLVDANDMIYNSEFQKNNYYYIGKYKLNEDFYVIGYDKYSWPMMETCQVIAIYDIKKKAINSKLIIDSKYNVNRTSEYKKDVFYIKTLYTYIPTGKECQPGVDNYTRKELLEKYRINNNFVFEKVN